MMMNEKINKFAQIQLQPDIIVLNTQHLCDA